MSTIVIVLLIVLASLLGGSLGMYFYLQKLSQDLKDMDVTRGIDLGDVHIFGGKQ